MCHCILNFQGLLDLLDHHLFAGLIVERHGHPSGEKRDRTKLLFSIPLLWQEPPQPLEYLYAGHGFLPVTMDTIE